MTTHHEAVIHGFVRKALRYAGDEADLDEREQLEEELPEYADTIIRGGGYDLDQRIAALEAENARMREALFKHTKGLKRMAGYWRTRASDHYCQTYNTGMAQGLNGAAGMLEEYVKEAWRALGEPPTA